MNNIKFFQLELKKFKRSKNLQKKIFFKIMSFLGLFFLALYAFGIVVGSFFIIKHEFPNTDPFVKINSYIFIFLVFSFFVPMYIPSDNEAVRPFMILPVNKSYLTKRHILKNLLHPVNIILFISLFTLIIVLIANGYQTIGIFSWFISVISTLIFINLMLFFSEKNQVTGMIFSILLIVIVWKFKLISSYLKPLGHLYYKTYKNPVYTLIFITIAASSFYFVYRYIMDRFYLDTGFKKKKKEIVNVKLNWTNRFGKMGTFLKNDIRLILRNPRTKQIFYGSLFMFLLGLFIFGTNSSKKDVFNKIEVAFFITGYFIIGFGGFIPAWDGKYYKLLMSQNIKYREYLESKWWLMVVATFIMTLLSLPFGFFGKNIFWMLLSMGIFNLGFNSFAVLVTGIYNNTAIDLDKKVKAFQNNQSFDFKILFFTFLRIFIPIIIFLIIYKMFGIKYAVATMFIIGMLGLALRKQILDMIAKLYHKRKYFMISAFDSEDE